MKKKIILLLTVLIIWSVGTPAYAAEFSNSELQDFWDNVDSQQILDALPERVQRELKEIELEKPDSKALSETDPQSIFRYVLNALKDEALQPFKALARMFGAIVLLSLLQGLRTTANQNKGILQVYEIVSLLVISASFAKPVIGCITSSAAAIADCSDFILSFLPVFSGILIACGQAASASATHVFLFWMCQLTSRFASESLVPMVGFYLVFSLVGSVFPSQNLSGISATAKSVVVWALGLIMTLFVGSLTLSSIISASGDNLGTRTARFLLGSFVPVVGGALSEAFTTAQSCLSLIKSSVGVYGIVASGLIFLPAAAQLVLWYFSLNISAAAAQAFGLSGIVSMLKAVASALGILLAMLLCFMLILMVSVTLILMVGQVVR